MNGSGDTFQIHCAGSLWYIDNLARDTYISVHQNLGKRLACIAARAVATSMLMELENRLSWSKSDLRNWEEQEGYDLSMRLPRGLWADASYDITHNLNQFRREMRRKYPRAGRTQKTLRPIY